MQSYAENILFQVKHMGMLFYELKDIFLFIALMLRQIQAE